MPGAAWCAAAWFCATWRGLAGQARWGDGLVSRWRGQTRQAWVGVAWYFHARPDSDRQARFGDSRSIKVVLVKAGFGTSGVALSGFPRFGTLWTSIEGSHGMSRSALARRGVVGQAR